MTLNFGETGSLEDMGVLTTILSGCVIMWYDLKQLLLRQLHCKWPRSRLHPSSCPPTGSVEEKIFFQKLSVFQVNLVIFCLYQQQNITKQNIKNDKIWKLIKNCYTFWKLFDFKYLMHFQLQSYLQMHMLYFKIGIIMFFLYQQKHMTIRFIIIVYVLFFPFSVAKQL